MIFNMHTVRSIDLTNFPTFYDGASIFRHQLQIVALEIQRLTQSPLYSMMSDILTIYTYLMLLANSFKKKEIQIK
jgi:hypothetical protein